MRKAKNLIGLKAISQQEGKDLGKVHDLLFSRDSRQLLGLLMHERGLFGIGDATAIPWGYVREIGTHAVMVPAADAIIKVHSDNGIADAYDNELTLTSKQLTTDRGETLGKISDLYLDEAGNVVGYEVSGGLFSDAFNGKRYLDAPSDITVGKDVILMPHKIVDDLNKQMEEQPGGIKGALGAAGETIGDTYDSAKETVVDKYDDIASASVDKQREYVIGKTAGTDVIIPADKATMATPAALAEGDVESGADPSAPSAGEMSSGEMSSGEMSSGEMSSGGLELGDFGQGDLTTGAIDIEPVRANPEAIVPAGEVQYEDDPLVPSNQTPQPSQQSPLSKAVLSGLNTSDSEPQEQETITNLQKSTPATATDIDSSGEVVDGEVLVRKGETITAEHADRAIETGVLAKLVASAGAGHAQGSDATAKAQGALGTAQEKTQGALSSAQQSAEDAAIGKPSAFEIDAPDGSVIVAPGQIVTRDILDRADREGKKAQVISAAGAGAISEGAQHVYGEAKEVAVDVWDTVKEKTQQLIGYSKEKKHEYDEATLEKKIKDAVGRPVTRVILAPDDTIILNTGDIITNKAIQEAQAVDYVDMILDSVYQDEPEITPEMMRAQGEGDAALATQQQPTGGPITATVDDQDQDQ